VLAATGFQSLARWFSYQPLIIDRKQFLGFV